MNFMYFLDNSTKDHSFIGDSKLQISKPLKHDREIHMWLSIDDSFDFTHHT